MDSHSPLVRPAEPAELEAVARAFLTAFADEPMYSWALAGGTSDDLDLQFHQRLLAPAIADGEILLARSGGKIVGLADWQDLTSADRPRQEATEFAEYAARGDSAVLGRLATALRIAEEHHPDNAHLFLSAIAVSPQGRGLGVGSALLRYLLDHADEFGKPMYLEASSTRARALYQRHGFEVDGAAFTLPQDGPTLWPMWRPAVAPA